MTVTSSSPGRRVAKRRRTPLDPLGVVSVLAVAAAALVLTLAQVSHPAAEPQVAGGVVRVDRLTAACVGGGGQRSEVLSVAAPGIEGADGGTLRIALAGGQEREVRPERGVVRDVAGAAADAPALVVDAEKGAAVGRTTSRFDRDSSGLAAQECSSSRSRWWFTGAGASLDHTSDLVLANVDPGPAVVDVVVRGADGEVDSVGTRGMTIAPGEVLTMPLVDVAPQSEELSIQVDAERGRVVAAVDDSFAAGAGGSPGGEWIPSQEEPSRTMVLGPLPQRADRRTLVVANPTGREALVDLQVSGQSGSFAPAGAEQLRVPAGAVATADLTSAVGSDPSAVRLSSPVPVTATLRSVEAGEVSYAAVVPPLSGAAIALVPDGVSGAMHLTSAGGAAATASLSAHAADGAEVDRTELSVPPGATAAWSPRGRVAYVLVDPGRGRLAGGAVLSSGSGVTQVPLRPLPVDLRRPAVVPAVR